MRLIDLLNKLEQDGMLTQLYQAGAVTLAVYAQREVYNTYHALLATPQYADQPSKAAYATALECRVARSTVYNALRCLRQEVDATS